MKTKFYLTTIISFLLIIFLSTAYAAQVYTVTKLTNDSNNDTYPQINDKRHVVWQGGTTGNQIFLYDGSSTTSLGNGSEPQINSNGDVVWTGIYLYDASSHTTEQITSSGVFPQFNDNQQITWVRLDGPDFDVFFYDEPTINQLTNNGYPDQFPKINNNGHVVWWGEIAPGTNHKIFLYNGTDIAEIASGEYPSISDTGYIAWQWKSAVNNSEIYLYNGSTITELTNPSYSNIKAKVNNNGKVTWTGYTAGNANSEIFFYNGSAIHQLTNTPYKESRQQINDEGFIVWEGNGKIFLYDGSEITQISDSAYDSHYPQINELGDIVWTGSNGNGGEIFLAKRQLSLAEKVQLEADYILACQYINPGDAAHGAINDIFGYPTWIVPRENGMAILGLLLADKTLPEHDPSYLERANLSMDFLVSIQEDDGAWCDQYVRQENGQVIEVSLSKSPTHAAEVMMAMYMLGYREDRYDTMKAAAQYLFECQDHGYQQKLICGGKDVNGNFYGWNWITDNSYAYGALLAARGWAMVKGENDFAQDCEVSAGKILEGINEHFYKGPDWWTIVDETGSGFYFDGDNGYGRISWMNFAPQFLDLPATGVGNLDLGEWIHDTFQQSDGGCLWGEAHPNREYPGISFQSSFCWFDLGQTDYANAAVNWAQNSSLWQRLKDPNGVNGGWIDWVQIDPPPPPYGQPNQEWWWYRFIDTSFYSIACWLGGYDFTVFNNLPPEIYPIGDKTVYTGRTLSFEVFADDPDDAELQYSVINLPSGATFNTETHIFSWTPQSYQSGQYHVKFEVSDGFLIDNQEITITVRKRKLIPATAIEAPHRN